MNSLMLVLVSCEVGHDLLIFFGFPVKLQLLIWFDMILFNFILFYFWGSTSRTHLDDNMTSRHRRVRVCMYLKEKKTCFCAGDDLFQCYKPLQTQKHIPATVWSSEQSGKDVV